MTRKSYLQRILPAILLLMSVSAASGFDDPVSHAAGGSPSGVTIGDINGDGLADVAAASAGVSLLLNDGSGLGPEQLLSDGPGDGRYVAIEDVDSDGDRDLVVLVRDGDGLIVVLRNQGDGTFVTPEPRGVWERESLVSRPPHFTIKISPVLCWRTQPDQPRMMHARCARLPG